MKAKNKKIAVWFNSSDKEELGKLSSNKFAEFVRFVFHKELDQLKRNGGEKDGKNAAGWINILKLCRCL